MNTIYSTMQHLFHVFHQKYHTYHHIYHVFLCVKNQHLKSYCSLYSSEQKDCKFWFFVHNFH